MAAERILIVEDNEKNMKLFRDVLRLTGTTRWRRRPASKRSSSRLEHAPDLVLMDIRLPGDGRHRGTPSAARGRANGRIPVVALTAQAMQGDRERFLEAGFNGYISKPVNIVEFIGTVRHYCEGRESRRGSSGPSPP